MREITTSIHSIATHAWHSPETVTEKMFTKVLAPVPIVAISLTCHWEVPSMMEWRQKDFFIGYIATVYESRPM